MMDDFTLFAAPNHDWREDPLPYAREILLILCSYALGCFSTGYYLVRFRTGKDIRKLGSGNTGTRNAGRALGKSGLVITFLGDAGKGAIVALVASYLRLEEWAVMLAITAVVAGHIWPVQLGFRGGKGVATAVGALIVIDWQLVAVLGVVTLLVFVLVRQFTPGGLTAVLLAPLVSFALGQSPVVILGVAALAVVILIAHRADVRLIFTTIRGRTGKSRHRLPD